MKFQVILVFYRTTGDKELEKWLHMILYFFYLRCVINIAHLHLQSRQSRTIDHRQARVKTSKK